MYSDLDAPSRTVVRLATLNIGGPSMTRADRLLRYVPSLDADALVLTETRCNAGTRWLLDGLRRLGWSVVDPAIADTHERGVALAFRQSADATGCEIAPRMTLAHRFAGATVPSLAGGVLVLGVYVPSRNASAAKIERKRTFVEQFVQRVREYDGQPLLVLGDFNVVGRHHVPRYAAFKSWEYEFLDALGEAGLVDAFAHLHPAVQAHSWIGRKGAGYQYDYALVSAELTDSLVGCVYDHGPRDAGLTDHAAVVLSIDGMNGARDGGAAGVARDLLGV